MIYMIDDFIDKEFFQIIQNYLNDNSFEKVEVGEKNFYIQESNKDFDDYIISKLEIIEGKSLKNILSFFRQATNKLDISWRIHSDLNIKGEKPDRAIVLYISPRELEELHGTALWEHEIYGNNLPNDFSDEKYNDLLKIDAENLDMWRLNSVLGYESNRLISYPSSYFHSKYPNKGWKSGRKVFVMFYKFV